MESKIIKVVDEHGIDRDATCIFGMDINGSEYACYWIKRDDENSNIFVSKLVKNLDGTSNLLNIDVQSEKNTISEIIKELIKKAVGDEVDTLANASITLDDGKNINIFSVLVNKEQSINVQKTYITTVKNTVVSVATKYYNSPVEAVEVKKDETLDVMPQVIKEPEIVGIPTVTEPVELPKDESITSQIVASPEAVVSTPEVKLPETIVEQLKDEALNEVPQPVVDLPATEVVEIKPQELPVVEETPNEIANTAPQIEVNLPQIDNKDDIGSENLPVIEEEQKPETLEVLPQMPESVEVKTNEEPKVELPTEVIPEVKEIAVEPSLPVSEPKVEEPVVPSIPTPIVTSPIELETSNAPLEPTAQVVSPILTPETAQVNEEPKLVLDASKEFNLNMALGEASKDSSIPVTSIEPIREFGTDEVKQPAIEPIVNLPEPNPQVKTLSMHKAGFVNSKFFMVIAITFFLASCVFLGYEVFQYFQIK